MSVKTPSANTLNQMKRWLIVVAFTLVLAIVVVQNARLSHLEVTQCQVWTVPQGQCVQWGK